MTIQVGQTLPDATFTVLRDSVVKLTRDDVFAGRKVVLFAVPGAFTPTCSERHVPGYVQHHDEFTRRGITVACLAVNDAFVMRAWARELGVPDDLLMLSDGNGDFVKALGLDIDLRQSGMGLRAKRFALYAEDGIVRVLNVEAPAEFRVSSAEAMLDAIV